MVAWAWDKPSVVFVIVVAIGMIVRRFQYSFAVRNTLLYCAVTIPYANQLRIPDARLALQCRGGSRAATPGGRRAGGAGLDGGRLYRAWWNEEHGRMESWIALRVDSDSSARARVFERPV